MKTEALGDMNAGITSMAFLTELCQKLDKAENNKAPFLKVVTEQRSLLFRGLLFITVLSIMMLGTYFYSKNNQEHHNDKRNE